MAKKNVKPIVGASAATPLQAIVASNATGEEAPITVQSPVGSDPYKPVQYVLPENPNDTSIVDKETESSDVDSDDESFHTKARHILRRLQSGKYDGHFAEGVYRCPFCTRRLRATDFNCLLNHVVDLGSSNPKVGQTVNVYSFMAHHKALGIHLRNLQDIHRRNL